MREHLPPTVRLVQPRETRRPTAKEIAAEAGVSLRTLWVAVDDMEGLFMRTVSHWVRANRRLARPIDIDLPVGERIASYVDQRAKQLGDIAPAARAAAAAAGSPALASGRADHLRNERDRLSQVFAPELAGADRSDLLLDALLAATSWNCWAILRDDQRLSVAESMEILRRTLRGLLT
ncbi:hypothetical protein ACF3NT_10955 [Naumannella halotolerans]|uniref:hypothetical protein n=1 Tax=Naumannella halotolerans TaxID=993414 RepID=UPI00370D01E8